MTKLYKSYICSNNMLIYFWRILQYVPRVACNLLSVLGALISKIADFFLSNWYKFCFVK